MKRLTCLSTILLSAAALADPADPQISNVRLEQNDLTRRVTVMYDLDETAVVTMDVLTNGVSIGGANVQHVVGDCFKKVAAGNNHVVTWDPHLSWPGHKFGAGVVSVRMTAWALDNTPDYMAVDISATGGADTQAYYPDADFVAGGVTNHLYKTSMLLMRKIMAKDVTWTMGSTPLETARGTTETPHQATLTNNYYIGVFEVTQAQWALIQSTRPMPSTFTNAADRAMRPVENVCYNEIRNNNSATGDADYNWPADPKSNSFLGKLRDKTKLDFDLPSEAQWEFAARAGNGDTMWGDGSGILNTDTDENLDLLGRYKMNGGYVDGIVVPDGACGAENGTAIVGSYAPNSWGLYDMAGNVSEWCLDWSEDNITARNGMINIDYDNPANTLSGAGGKSRVHKGGNYTKTAGDCRPAFRGAGAPSGRFGLYGFRVVCTAGLR